MNKQPNQRRGKALLALTYFIALALLLAACDTAEVAGDPVPPVEQYLQAKVAADAEGVAALLCSAMETDLDREANSFANRSGRIENMSCERVGGSNVVSCTGTIIGSYGTQDREFQLGDYTVMLEDGEWRWCGEVSE